MRTQVFCASRLHAPPQSSARASSQAFCRYAYSSELSSPESRVSLAGNLGGVLALPKGLCADSGFASDQAIPKHGIGQRTESMGGLPGLIHQILLYFKG